MRFVSFNINGLRARTHQLDQLINKLQPDVLGLQETKVHNDLFPIKKIKKYGYHVYYDGQKQYHGVALFLKKLPLIVTRGFPLNPCPYQKRIITAQITTSIGSLTVINGYFPQGENNQSEKFIYKKQFYQNLKNYIQNNYSNESLLLIMGDMNISPTDLDVGIGKKNTDRWIKMGKCAFLPEERQWITDLMNWGLIDIYRSKYPYQNNRYSWFSYQSNGFKNNRGLRIDLVLVTQPLAHLCTCSGINYDIRNMTHPSDHAPIWVDLDIEYDVSTK
ncbi:exodeoxyribonuclease III [Candidatus Blochmanniella vafra str. BVAF]|uniref:Exodeoxyribonuclease III n=1 Tax=Blochmanniella vafra (strain BVAF) TaxID=859654 RepID=E8Q6D1_BLOVB|nr:exodeoxyribonuclease III [Candidatus Blochmannia vafer]ADV33825.1 exodeoxyribonuclease III [Candidatus Blochmannia vafer str. BVAF]